MEHQVVGGHGLDIQEIASRPMRLHVSQGAGEGTESRMDTSKTWQLSYV